MKSKTIITIVLILAMTLGLIGCTKAPAVTYQTPFPEEGTVGGVEYYITPDTSYFRKSGLSEIRTRKSIPYFNFSRLSEIRQ